MQYDYMKDDDLTPEEKEELLNAEMAEIGNMILEDEASAPHLINLEKYRTFYMCERTIEAAMAESGNKVTSKLNEPFASMASISIVGENIHFESAETFNALCRFSSNVEVYPLTSGEIKMTFTFLSMTKRMNNCEE